jgi:hypothetical protein
MSDEFGKIAYSDTFKIGCACKNQNIHIFQSTAFFAGGFSKDMGISVPCLHVFSDAGSKTVL